MFQAEMINTPQSVAGDNANCHCLQNLNTKAQRHEVKQNLFLSVFVPWCLEFSCRNIVNVGLLFRGSKSIISVHLARVPEWATCPLLFFYLEKIRDFSIAGGDPRHCR